MPQTILVSIQLGMPQRLSGAQSVTPADAPWTSAIHKMPVVGRVWLGFTNLQGDGQADLKAHGGPDKAVLAYAAGHYERWSAEVGLPESAYGGFGENFTIRGQLEETVCIGDIYRIGGAVVQVSQPRQPCWKLSRRWGIPDLQARVEQTGRTGWYLRVLAEGYVEAGGEVELLERPHPQWTVTETASVMRRRGQDRAAELALSRCEALSAGWREKLTQGKESTGGARA